jgi:drug/metabolite transporter (DMT)-like permease
LPIVVMLSAYFLGKEKLEATSFIAAVISLIGVGVLMWQDDLLTLF